MILLLLFYDYRLEIFREGIGIEAILLMLNQVSFSVIYIIDAYLFFCAFIAYLFILLNQHEALLFFINHAFF